MTMLIRLPGKSDELVFIFGPYRERVRGTYGVKLAPEAQGQCDLLVPIPDYGVPKQDDFEVALARIIRAAETGQVVYVGCMGGIGRTGMVLAGLRRVLCRKGGGEAIAWARANYLGHTIETRDQERLVCAFDAGRVRKLVAEHGLCSYLKNLLGPHARRQPNVDTL